MSNDFAELIKAIIALNQALDGVGIDPRGAQLQLPTDAIQRLTSLAKHHNFLTTADNSYMQTITQLAGLKISKRHPCDFLPSATVRADP